MNPEKLNLLFIAGFSRCGSTILSNVLGELDGFFNAGELMYVWNRMSTPEGICGCGAHVCECEIWKPIFADAFGPGMKVDHAEMIRIRNSHWASRNIPLWLWVSSTRNRLLAETEALRANLSRLYRAIARAMPGRVVIDSSKNPFHLFMLSMLPEVDVSVVHIVRDPRANAYSWNSKKKGFSERSIASSALSWDARNGALALLTRTFKSRQMTLRYEDFVSDPRTTVQAIARLMGRENPDLSFMTEDGVKMGANHCVYGNPDLFKSGVIKLRLDDRWKNMKTWDKALTTALTWPMMLRFGY